MELSKLAFADSISIFHLFHILFVDELLSFHNCIVVKLKLLRCPANTGKLLGFSNLNSPVRKKCKCMTIIFPSLVSFHIYFCMCFYRERESRTPINNSTIQISIFPSKTCIKTRLKFFSNWKLRKLNKSCHRRSKEATKRHF